MGYVKFHTKRVYPVKKARAGKLFSVAFWPALAGLFISGLILVQRPLIQRMLIGCMGNEQASSLNNNRIALLLGATEGKYFSFKLSENQKSISETYRLGASDLVFDTYLSEKNRWKTVGRRTWFVRLIQTTPIYILGHALLH